MRWFPESLKIDPLKPVKEPAGFRHNGTTALHKAVESRSLAKIRLLVANGADVMAINSSGKTARDLIAGSRA